MLCSRGAPEDVDREQAVPVCAGAIDEGGKRGHRGCIGRRSHRGAGDGWALLYDKLHPEVRVLLGTPRTRRFSGLDASFAGVFLVELQL